MKARLLWDKILRMGIKLCMLTGVAFTFAACYAPAHEPNMEFEAIGDITNEENEPIESIEVAAKYRGYPLVTGYSNEEGAYRIHEGYFPDLFDSIDIVARDTSGIYEPDSVRVKVEIDPTTKRGKWFVGTFSVQHDFQLKKK